MGNLGPLRSPSHQLAPSCDRLYLVVSLDGHLVELAKNSFQGLNSATTLRDWAVEHGADCSLPVSPPACSPHYWLPDLLQCRLGLGLAFLPSLPLNSSPLVALLLVALVLRLV